MRFKATSAFLLLYKRQFQRDALRDLMQLESATDKTNGQMDLDKIDTDTFYRLLWVLARNADPTIAPDLVEWVGSFDDFPLIDIFTEAQELLLKSLQVSKKV